MSIYLTVDILIILFGIFFINNNVQFGNKKINGRLCFFAFAAVLLTFISAFRGNFTTDYDHYVSIYEAYDKSTITSILQRGYLASPETGYVLYQYVIGKISHDPLFIFVISSIIIVFGNLIQIKKDSYDILLGTLLFIEAGIYFTSFNLMRQCLAASITVMGSRYLYERKPFRYLLVILLASTFHVSALIMIPFYFFSTFRLNRNIIIYLPIVVAFVAIAPITINFVQDYFWSWHELTEYSGYSWKNIVLPAAISVYAFTSYSITSYKSRSSKSDLMVHKKERISTENALQLKTDNKNNIQLNATIMYLTFSIYGLLFSLASRFATFFSIYAIVLFSNQIQNSKYRKLLTFGIIIVLVLYGYITKVGDFPYYFVWDK